MWIIQACRSHEYMLAITYACTGFTVSNVTVTPSVLKQLCNAQQYWLMSASRIWFRGKGVYECNSMIIHGYVVLCARTSTITTLVTASRPPGVLLDHRSWWSCPVRNGIARRTVLDDRKLRDGAVRCRLRLWRHTRRCLFLLLPHTHFCARYIHMCANNRA